MTKTKVSAILPIYNEEKTLAFVVKTLLSSPILGEVICINDGSTDKSLEILQSFGSKIRLINVHPNKGKGNALVEGVKASKGEIVAFFDGDYISFSADNVKELLEPILNGKARIVMGMRPIIKKDISGYLWRALTGERAYYKKDLETYLNLTELAQSRFGSEVYLNTLNSKLPVKRVKMNNLEVMIKFQKTAKRQAVKDYTKEAMEIIKQLARHKKKSINSIRQKFLDFSGDYLSF
jgi:glycosyltransferase involved in cell wall biosynthesis